MRLAGLNKLSTLDYPSKVSAVVFTQGCDFSCPYCQNPDLISASGSTLAETEVMAFLEKRKNLLDAVVVSGGEPTLQPGLPGFLARVKAMGYLVKLDTNGSNPHVVKKLIASSLVDYVALDLKADLSDWPEALATKKRGHQSPAKNVLAALRLLRDGGFPAEFRTTCVRPFVTPESILSLARLAAGEIPWYLQRYRPERVLNPRFMALHADQPGDDDLAAFQKLASPYLPCHIR
ncbi:MAG: anaerobic ribonucleoside-triphosphate reductase activating protein [Deltaproteobacteria bacterium]|jgi:pyruvate formate lyase activating enzyme|nr:anaerobic ribonucleoside-triphosphate reductase activating protein [Deltaproteobacteria bacterium]